MDSTVVNIRKKELNKRGISDFTKWNSRPNTLYIGRNMNYYVPGTLASKWKNPYPVKTHGLDKSLELYEQHIRDTPSLWEALPELDGLELGCWCKPDRCHGDILLKLRQEKN